MITIHVKRFDSEKDNESHIETYEIEKSSGMKVLDALEEINNKYDADISFMQGRTMRIMQREG